MRRIRINNFYDELTFTNTDNNTKCIENNLNDIKAFSISNEIDRLKVKCFISKMIMFLLEIIDIAAILGVLFLDDISTLLITVFIINIVVGIVFSIIPDFELELYNKEKEYNNIKRVIY